jgi:hypothetical protein
MKLALFSFVLVAFTAATSFAQDLNFGEYRKFLMSGSQGTKKMAIQTTCTNTTGVVYRVGETGYDKCLSEVKTQYDQKNNSSAAGVGTSIHIGN